MAVQQGAISGHKYTHSTVTFGNLESACNARFPAIQVIKTASFTAQLGDQRLACESFGTGVTSHTNFFPPTPQSATAFLFVLEQLPPLLYFSRLSQL